MSQNDNTASTNYKDWSNEELLDAYRFVYKHQVGEYSQWKQVEREIIRRMTK